MPRAKRKRPKPPFPKRGAVIATHRDYFGLSVKEAAKRADLSYKTYALAEHGESVSDDTLLKVCRALDLIFDLLKYEPENHPRHGQAKDAIAESRAMPVLKADTPHSTFSKAQAIRGFIDSLAHLINAASVIERIFLQEGRTILGLSMTYGDIQQLCQAFLAGKLESLRIRRIRILPLAERLRVALLAPDNEILKAISKLYDIEFTMPRGMRELASTSQDPTIAGIVACSSEFDVLREAFEPMLLRGVKVFLFPPALYRDLELDEPEKGHKLKKLLAELREWSESH